MRKILLALTLALSLVFGSLAAPLQSVLLGGALAAGSTKQTTVKEITIKDMVGRKVTIKQPVQRVVAIGPGALRLYTYVNGTKNLVGVEQLEKNMSNKPYSLAYPELAKLPVIGPGGPDSQPDPEKIVAVKPDVIFCIQLLNASGADKLQSQTKVPVVVLDYGDAAVLNKKLTDSIALIGKITGNEKRANEVVSYIQKARDDLNKRVQNEKVTPPVYVGAVSYKGTRGFGSTQGKHPVLAMIKANNVADKLGKTGAITVDLEQILLWNPEIIFIDEGGLSLVKEDYSKNKKYYQSLKAFKNKQVYGLLPYNFYNTNIETAIADAYYAGKVIYPKAFANVDPAKKADEIYKFFLNKALYQTMAKEYGGFKQLQFD